MPNPKRKIELERKNSEPSPKVSVPSSLLLIVSIVWTLLNGLEVDPEQATLAAAAVVNFIVGFFKRDKITVEDAVDSLESQTDYEVY